MGHTRMGGRAAAGWPASGDGIPRGVAGPSSIPSLPRGLIHAHGSGGPADADGFHPLL